MNPSNKLHELSWLGGLIDGEGCITIVQLKQKNFKLSPHFTITNTNLVIVETARRILAENWVFANIQKAEDNRTDRKPKLTVYVREQARMHVAMTVLEPYLIGKLEQCQLMKEFVALRMNRVGSSVPYSLRQIEIFERIKFLNRRGPDEIAETA